MKLRNFLKLRVNKVELTKDNVKKIENNNNLTTTTNVSNFTGDKLVPLVQRMQDKEVHDLMKKRNVYCLRESDFGNSQQTNSQEAEAKLFEFTPVTSSLKKNMKTHIYINNNQILADESELSLQPKSYANEVIEESGKSLKQISKEKKIDFLAHSFKLGYGANQISRKQLATINEVQDLRIGECKELKQKNEKQNFKAVGVGKFSIDQQLNNDPNKLTYSKDALKPTPWPMDYWKTNFDLSHAPKDNQSSIDNFSALSSKSANKIKRVKELLPSLTKNPYSSHLDGFSRNKAKSKQASFTFGFDK